MCLVGLNNYLKIAYMCKNYLDLNNYLYIAKMIVVLNGATQETFLGSHL